MIYRTQSKTFSNLKKIVSLKIAQGIGVMIHEALLLMKFSQTKPQIKNKIKN